MAIHLSLGHMEPHLGRGGRMGSAIAPFKRAMMVFYRLSIVSHNGEPIENHHRSFEWCNRWQFVTVALSVTIRPQFAIECLRLSNQQGVGHFGPNVALLQYCYRLRPRAVGWADSPSVSSARTLSICAADDTARYTLTNSTATCKEMNNAQTACNLCGDRNRWLSSTHRHITTASITVRTLPSWQCIYLVDSCAEFRQSFSRCGTGRC